MKNQVIKVLSEEPKREFVNNTSKWNIEDFEESKQETFKHEFKVLTKEEVMEGRSSAYDFIDFNKQETLEEASESFFNKRAKEEGFQNWTQIIVQQEWKFIESFPIEFAKLQQEISYNEEEVNLLQKSILIHLDDKEAEGIINELFEQFKKK